MTDEQLTHLKAEAILNKAEGSRLADEILELIARLEAAEQFHWYINHLIGCEFQVTDGRQRCSCHLQEVEKTWVDIRGKGETL